MTTIATIVFLSLQPFSLDSSLLAKSESNCWVGFLTFCMITHCLCGVDAFLLKHHSILSPRIALRYMVARLFFKFLIISTVLLQWRQFFERDMWMYEDSSLQCSLLLVINLPIMFERLL